MSEAAQKTPLQAANEALERRREEAIRTNLLLVPAHRRRLAAEAEARRRAESPPQRPVLVRAGDRRAVCTAELGAIETALVRAREHRNAVAERRNEIAQACKGDDEAATARLIAELTGPGPIAADDPGEDMASSAQIAAAERELAVAERALKTLEGRKTELEKTLAGLTVEMRRTTALLLIDVATRQAERIEAQAAALTAERDELDAICRALTDLQRRDAVRPIWPPNLGSAVNPIDPPRPGRASEAAVAIWSKVAAELIADPSAHPELDEASDDPPALHA